jgi:TatD DNase family protein
LVYFSMSFMATTTPARDCSTDSSDELAPLVDSHCHLTLDPLYGRYRQALSVARSVGVCALVVPAYDESSWSRAEQLACAEADELPVLRWALGIHPWAARREALSALETESFRRRTRALRAVAVGEIGLDFAYPAREIQLQLFERQLELASELGLPAILHCHRAWSELLSVWKRFAGLTGVVHGYSRGPDLASQLVDVGLYLGIGPLVLRESARRLREAISAVPRERVLLETDAPTAPPKALPGSGQPAQLPQVGQRVAQIWKCDIAEVASVCLSNSRDLFGKDLL